MQSGPIQFGLTGLGNFAAELCDRLVREQASPNPRGVIRAICAPQLDRFHDRVRQLRGMGITVVDQFDQLLDSDVECIWLPLPIDLHREFTERALAAGKHVLCEKPAAGSMEDVDAMIAARDRAGRMCAIGYQDIYQPAVHELKQRLIRGEFGVVISGSVLGCWPRSQKYYTRNDWAGKILRDGKWILDSPANNAMAHYIHLAQYLMGTTEPESATPSEVEAELYRANPIENFDTCSLRLTFDGGAHLLVHLTHACRTTIDVQVVLRAQFATIRYLPRLYRIDITRSGITETIPLIEDRHAPVIETIHRALRDGKGRPISTLEMARAHTVAMNAASAASPVVDVPASQVEVVDDQGHPLRTIRGIEQSLRAASERGRMLHELSVVGWSKPAGDVNTTYGWRFEGPYSR